MKTFSLFRLFFVLALVNAASAGIAHHDEHCNDFGSALFSSGPDGWYIVATNSYPSATIISHDRNRGTSEGHVYLSPSGLTIGEEGDYEVSVTAIMTNPVDGSSIIIPVFLVAEQEGDPLTTEINPADPNPIGGVGTVTSDAFTTVHGTGILKDVMAGTRLNVVITNAGYPDPQDVTVIAWAMTASRLH